MIHADRDSQPMRALCFEDFVNTGLDSLSWYDLLPGDGASINDIPEAVSIDQLRERLLSTDRLKPLDIDLLAAHLLGITKPIKPLNSWKVLAQHISRFMSEQLKANGNRSLRMRAQRLNYYIEALIAERPSESDKQLLIAEKNLKGMKPWDFVKHHGATWWISSGAPNIYRDNDNHLEQWTLDLPTQLDPLPNGDLSVGSLYSNGALLHGVNGWSRLSHPHPVPLIFIRNGTRFFVDRHGRVWRDLPRQQVGQASCKQVHFARYFNGIVYCMDNSDYGNITLFDMEASISRGYSVLPVQVCNDIAVTDEYCYLIDKQQGSVFKFDRCFNFVSRALSFGREEACLLDPVSLRRYRDKLLVTSWLANKVTILRCF